MRLPSGADAVVDRRKIADYALNPLHPDGQHKARVFAAALGIRRENADDLRNWLIDLAAASEDAVEIEPTEHGRRFVIRAEMRYLGRSALVRSAWILRKRETFPRLVSVFVE